MEAAARDSFGSMSAAASPELAKMVGELNDIRIRDLSKECQADAEYTALFSVVAELALHAGISKERFEALYAKRVSYFHGLHLRKLEDEDKQLAAQIDFRTEEPVSDIAEIEPLFPGEKE
jgi:hypothetical protein